MEKDTVTRGRPQEYTPEFIERAREYLDSCIDEETEFHSTRGIKSDSFERIVNVKIPTMEGLAIHLGIARSTLYLWMKQYPEFSDIIEQLQATQADRLMKNGLAGTYNPTIAKVLLTKHGYREGQDITTNDKDVPQPIINVQRNDSIQENK